MSKETEMGNNGRPVRRNQFEKRRLYI